MHDFDYEAPTTLERAVELLAGSTGRARPFAGGTDLIDQMRIGRHAPQLLVDTKKVAELNVLEADSVGLRLGAAVSCRSILANEQVAASYTALADSCRIIGGIQIQSRASVGGNLCNSGPAADSTPSVIALGGICVIAGPNGQREVAAESFCTGPGKNQLKEGELLVEIRFPPPQPQSGSHYRRFIPRNEMDIAVVGVGAAVVLDESGSRFEAVRLALGAVAPTPLLIDTVSEALAGESVGDRSFSRAAELAREAISPITDMRGTAEFRRHVTGILTERVLRASAARAAGEALDYRPGH